MLEQCGSYVGQSIQLSPSTNFYPQITPIDADFPLNPKSETLLARRSLGEAGCPQNW
jgi:hypothetical protein